MINPKALTASHVALGHSGEFRGELGWAHQVGVEHREEALPFAFAHLRRRILPKSTDLGTLLLALAMNGVFPLNGMLFFEQQ